MLAEDSPQLLTAQDVVDYAETIMKGGHLGKGRGVAFGARHAFCDSTAFRL